ncbi:MAG: ammonium transporter, partial [Desulfovibrio sp.]
MSIVLFKVVDVVMGLRVSEEDEIRGLDHSQHNETGYQF